MMYYSTNYMIVPGDATELEAFRGLVKVMKYNWKEDPNNFRVVRIVPAQEKVLG